MSYYLSVDIETTGLDPDTCQTLEIAAVLDSATAPFASAPAFHCYIKHPQIHGEAYALSMHAHILRAIATGKDAPCQILDPIVVMPTFADFLRTYIPNSEDRITVAGKNFGGFDRQFLRRLPNAELVLNRFRHRYLDTGLLWWDSEKDAFKLPDSDECLARAGLERKANHTAMADALDTCHLIRRHPRTALLWKS